MTFTLKFDMDNAAFEGGDFEVVRILRAIADRVEREGVPSHYQTVRDANGNDVGRYAAKEVEAVK